MRRRCSRHRRRGLLAAAAVAVGATLAGTSSPAGSQAAVIGSGSTFAQIAIESWMKDARLSLGLAVEFSATGSSAGRNQFAQGVVDWASSDIAFEPGEATGNRSFTYLPLVAGGTALMYNVTDVTGRRIEGLRLTGQLVMAMLNNEVTRWNDERLLAIQSPAVAERLRLVSQPIRMALRSGGSGTTAVFTGYLARVDPDGWARFRQRHGISPPGATFTSNMPTTVEIGANYSGSDSLTNAVAQPNPGGFIGYAETAWAVSRGLPVAYLQNAAGAWALPTAYNVAVALLGAARNPDGTQDLEGVWTNPDPSAYALSSYNYGIVPTSGLDAAKGDTLGRFVVLAVTAGQAKMAQLGYSPLPPNLVEQALSVVGSIPGAPSPPPLGDWGRYYLQLNVGGGGIPDGGTPDLVADSGGEAVVGTDAPLAGGGGGGGGEEAAAAAATGAGPAAGAPADPAADRPAPTGAPAGGDGRATPAAGGRPRTTPGDGTGAAGDGDEAAASAPPVYFRDERGVLRRLDAGAELADAAVVPLPPAPATWPLAAGAAGLLVAVFVPAVLLGRRRRRG